RIDVVVLDKTGTITRGEPSVTDVRPLPPFDERSLLTTAARVERLSEHPLAQAVVAAAERLPAAGAGQASGANASGGPAAPGPDGVRDFAAIPGHGVRALVDGRPVLIGNRKLMRDYGVDVSPLLPAVEELEQQGKTAMLIAVDKRPAGVIAVADTVKEHAAEAIAELRRMGVQVKMLTGDNARTARAIAAQVGLSEDDVIAEVLPDEKAAVVERLRRQGLSVAMVGDGINDAPALASADVGIAIGTGTDVAIEAADITLMSGDLRTLVGALRLSRETMRKIRQNLFWAFGYNTVGLPLAALGYLSPVLAGAAMAFSSVSVVTNAGLLRRFDPLAPFRQRPRNAAADALRLGAPKNPSPAPQQKRRRTPRPGLRRFGFPRPGSSSRSGRSTTRRLRTSHTPRVVRRKSGSESKPKKNMLYKSSPWRYPRSRMSRSSSCSRAVSSAQGVSVNSPPRSSGSSHSTSPFSTRHMPPPRSRTRPAAAAMSSGRWPMTVR